MKGDPSNSRLVSDFSRRSFGRVLASGALGVSALNAGCSVVFDSDSYDKSGVSGTDAGAAKDSGVSVARASGVLLIAGVLDGPNGGDATKEVFLARFDTAGTITGFVPQLQVLKDPGRYTARVDGTDIIAACQGAFLRSPIGSDGLLGWKGNDVPNIGQFDVSFVFAGPWLVAVAGETVSVLKFSDPKATWKAQSSKLNSKRRVPSVVFAKGHLYVIGGANSDQGPNLDGEFAAFDETSGTTAAFKTISPLPISPFGCGLVHAADQLYVVGGNNDASIVLQNDVHDRVFATALASDGTPGPWREQPTLLTPLADASVWVRGQKLYVAGGRRSRGNPSSVLVGSAQITANGDLAAWDFQSHARLPLGRFHSFAVVI